MSVSFKEPYVKIPKAAAVFFEDIPITKFALSSKECFGKGWVPSSDGSLQKTVDEIVSSIQTSISDCRRIFKAHANDLFKTPFADYVVWRFGDSRRITAAKFTKYSPATMRNQEPLMIRNKLARKSATDTIAGITATASPDTASQASSVLNVTTRTPTLITPFAFKHFSTSSYPKLKQIRWPLPGSDSKHSKLLFGTWTGEMSFLRVCTSSGVDSFQDLITNEVSNGFVYDVNGAMVANCSQDKYVTCYKPDGIIWFHATFEGGTYFDYITSEFKSWKGPPPWNNKNVLELQLNKIIALRFKGIGNFTLIYRSQIDNLYINVKSPDETEGDREESQGLGVSGIATKSEESRRKVTCAEFNPQEIVKTSLAEMGKLKKKYSELKSIKKNISGVFKKMDTLFSLFFHLQASKDAVLKSETVQPLPKLEYPTKIRETIICPLILRQQIVYQKTRLEAAAAQGLEARPSVTTKTWLQCNCSGTEIPIVSDIELQEYVESRAPSKQMLIICITNSKNAVSEVYEMLSEIYHTQNRKHKKPCIQLPLDSYRLLKYDLASAVNGTERTVPWLVEKYQVVDSMVMMFLKSRLLFCNFYFNGYGFDQHNFHKQIRRCFDLSRKGKHLPSDYKFGSSFVHSPSQQSMPDIMAEGILNLI